MLPDEKVPSSEVKTFRVLVSSGNLRFLGDGVTAGEDGFHSTCAGILLHCTCPCEGALVVCIVKAKGCFDGEFMISAETRSTKRAGSREPSLDALCRPKCRPKLLGKVAAAAEPTATSHPAIRGPVSC